MDIKQLIADYGTWVYVGAFVATFLEGETIILCAGLWVSQGLLGGVPLIAAAWLGSFAGDQCYFWLGRHFGVRLLDRFPRWRSGVDSALHWLERYNTAFILSFRFIYGVRNLSSFAMGLSAINWKRFLVLNFAAAGLWASTFVGIGYFLGQAFAAMLNNVFSAFGAMVGIALCMFALHRLHRRYLLRRQRRLLRVPHAVDVGLPPT